MRCVRLNELAKGSEFYFFYGNEDMPLPTCTEHTLSREEPPFTMSLDCEK